MANAWLNEPNGYQLWTYPFKGPFPGVLQEPMFFYAISEGIGTAPDGMPLASIIFNDGNVNGQGTYLYLPFWSNETRTFPADAATGQPGNNEQSTLVNSPVYLDPTDQVIQIGIPGTRAEAGNIIGIGFGIAQANLGGIFDPIINGGGAYETVTYYEQASLLGIVPPGGVDNPFMMFFGNVGQGPCTFANQYSSVPASASIISVQVLSNGGGNPNVCIIETDGTFYPGQEVTVNCTINTQLNITAEVQNFQGPDVFTPYGDVSFETSAPVLAQTGDTGTVTVDSISLGSTLSDLSLPASGAGDQMTMGVFGQPWGAVFQFTESIALAGWTLMASTYQSVSVSVDGFAGIDDPGSFITLQRQQLGGWLNS